MPTLTKEKSETLLTLIRIYILMLTVHVYTQTDSIDFGHLTGKFYFSFILVNCFRFNHVTYGMASITVGF